MLVNIAHERRSLGTVNEAHAQRAGTTSQIKDRGVHPLLGSLTSPGPAGTRSADPRGGSGLVLDTASCTRSINTPEGDPFTLFALVFMCTWGLDYSFKLSYTSIHTHTHHLALKP